jgi:predicted permease
MKDGSDPLEHLNAFNMLITWLTNFGVNLEEEDKVILLLASLPTSFNHLVTTLMYGKETLELEKVTSALL